MRVCSRTEAKPSNMRSRAAVIYGHAGWMESYPLAEWLYRVKCAAKLPKEEVSGCCWDTAIGKDVGQ